MEPSLDRAEAARLDFKSVYREHYRTVWWTVRGCGLPEAWIEDVVHDAFLIIHRRLPELEDPSRLRAWVIGIARNAAFSHRRSASRRRARLAALPEPEAPSAADSVVAYRQAWDRLHHFLGELGEEQREAFVLCELQGVAPAEVASVVGVSRNTVYSRLRLARSKLVDHFENPSRTELCATLREGRRQGQPTPAHKQRTWSALAGPLGLAPPIAATGPLAWLSTGKGLLLAGALGLATVGAAVAPAGLHGARRSGNPARDPGPPARTARDIRADQSPHPEAAPASDGRALAPELAGNGEAAIDSANDNDHGEAAGRAAVLTPAVAPTAGVPAPSSGDPLEQSASDRPPPSHGAPGAPRPPAAASVRTTGDGASPTDEATLAEELALLRRAGAELREGDHAAALATLDQHADDHPRSSLADERLALRVDALCAAGSTAEAQDLAARYVASHPGGRLAARLARPCASAGKKSTPR